MVLMSYAAIADQGITSTVHEKYVGQIVFTDKPEAIAFKKEIPSLFKNQFNASEAIYARLYLDKSIANTLHDGQKAYQSILMWNLSINGKKINHKRSFGLYKHMSQEELTYFTEYLDGSDKFSSWTSWRPYLLPQSGDPELKYGNVNIAARAFALALLELPAGEHEVELSLYSKDISTNNDTKVLARGSFQLLLSEADKSELVFKYTPPLPKNKWTGENSDLLIKQLENAFTNEINKKPLLVGLYGQDWQYNTYQLTGQEYRKLAGWAVFDDTDGDGQVPITTFNWISDKTEGKWSALRFDSHCNGCPDWLVEVEAVKQLIILNQ